MRSLIAAALLFTTPAYGADYAVDKAASHVKFSGEHAGTKFEGEFTEWDAEVSFDPAALDKSSLKATFKPASATTGNKMYDGTLPSADWFDVANHSEASFVSKSISGGTETTQIDVPACPVCPAFTTHQAKTYIVEGDLTIRGISHPAKFTFTLSDLAASPVIAKGSFTVDRLAYDLGKKSDATAEWVSKDITVTLEISATKK